MPLRLFTFFVEHIATILRDYVNAVAIEKYFNDNIISHKILYPSNIRYTDLETIFDIKNAIFAMDVDIICE